MKNVFKNMFTKRKRMTQEDLLKKFDIVVENFSGAEENLLTKETLLLSYQGNSRKRSITTHFGEQNLDKINWKIFVRKQEVEALNHENKNLFQALETYLVSSLKDYGLDLLRVRNELINNLYNIEVDFKQKYRNDDFFSDLKDLSKKVEELDGSLKLYKSKSGREAWKLILSVDENIQPAGRKDSLAADSIEHGV